MKPLSDQQRLFPVESDQLYREWRELVWRRQGYKYGMRWINVNGGELFASSYQWIWQQQIPWTPLPRNRKNI